MKIFILVVFTLSRLRKRAWSYCLGRHRRKKWRMWKGRQEKQALWV